MKKLTKSDKKMLLGVCSGLAEYFNIDATIIRILVVILAVALKVFPVVLIYIIAAIIMPDADSADFEKDAETKELPEKTQEAGKNKRKSESAKKSGESSSKKTHRSDEEFNSYFEK